MQRSNIGPVRLRESTRRLCSPGSDRRPDGSRGGVCATIESPACQAGAASRSGICRHGDAGKCGLPARLPDGRLEDTRRAESVESASRGADGDRFRAGELAGTPVNSRKFTLKVVPEEQIQQFIKYVQFKEVFQFFVREPVDLGIPRDHRRIQVKKTAQVLQMII